MIGKLASVGVVVALFISSTAFAQSNFGTVNLTTGFTPDPQVFSGTSGGAMAAQNMNSACRGWISPTPDHLLVLNSAFSFLRVFVESSADTTLVVQLPNGQMLCNDDAYGNNPAVEQSWSPGTYKIWIGSYQQGQNSQYTLKLTELRSQVPSGSSPAATTTTTTATSANPASPGIGALQIRSRRGNFKPMRLRTGFRPDPKLTSGRSGGRVDATPLGGTCKGWIADRPDHIVNLQSAFNFFRIFINSSADTTLVVLTPTGQWLCNDDAFGNNPAVDQQIWAPGKYLVWVGSYNQGEISPYTIGFTEIPDQH